MQTKKRAKSVAFGKPKKEEPKKEQTPSIDEEAKHIVASVELSKEAEPETKESAEAPEEKGEPKENPIIEKTDSGDLKTPEPEEVKAEEVKEEIKTEEPEKSEEENKEKEEVPAEIKDFAPSHNAAEESVASKEKTAEAGLPASSFFSESSFADDRRSRKKKGHLFFFVIVALISFVLGLALMAGISYGLKSNNISLNMDWLTSLQASPTPTSKPEPTPTPTEAQVDLSAYTISVLNGSGITGEASKLKTKLETAGFKVGTSGNADSEDYTKTQIKTKKTVSEAYVKKLTGELEKSYKVQQSSSFLTSGDADVVVTIGSETAK